MWTLVAVVIHIVNSIILVISWKSCETIDPAAPVKDNSWSCVRLYGPRWERTRYCALCRKSVPGLDHHWTVQFVLQVVYAILCLLWLHYCPFDDARTIGYVVKSCLFDTVRTIGYYIGAKNSELSWRLETRRHTLELVVTQVKTDLVVRENPSLLRRVMP
ncbi:unnamed protein product [Peronospora belbahrii]|uniref:Uncharacterized protein n=1 Tax=Peronospora belbahrii TaxID=622444 RepID=A0AAU9KZR2_9STRA|nr:unnamed protein product [Peronospora belbahrii]CAH0519499.1 unnamed protein product [Peronospora belbahrii]